MEVSELTPELAKQILEAAAARGISMDALLESVIERRFKCDLRHK